MNVIPKTSVVINIQILRAVAALTVAWAHLREIMPIEMTKNLPSGLFGVDIFFVVSGYIMVHTTSCRKQNPLAFFLNRIVRVVPLYYIFTIFIFLLTSINPDLFKTTSSNFSQLILSLSFIPFLKSENRIYPLYYLGWTLNYEIFFYLVFCLAMTINYKVRVYISFFILFIMSAYGYICKPNLNANIYVFFYTRQIILDFAMGMMSYRLIWITLEARKTIFFGLTMIIGLILLIVLPIIFPITDLIAPPTDTFLSYGIPAALILIGLVGLERYGWTVRSKIAVLLGNASYSLYLSHFLVVGVIISLIHRFDINNKYTILVCIMAIPIICIVGILCFLLVENPITRLAKKLERRMLRYIGI